MKPPSPAELRTEFDATRARIAADVNEIEGRLRTRVNSALDVESLPDTSSSLNLLEAMRLLPRLKGSTALAAFAGAAAGFVAMRRWGPRQMGRRS